MALGTWQRNSRKARKRARLAREKNPENARGYWGTTNRQYERRTSRGAGNYERGEVGVALRILRDFLHARYDDVPGIERFVAGRYHLVYAGHQPQYANEESWRFHLVPRGGRYWSGRFKPSFGVRRFDTISDRARWTPTYAMHGEVYKVYERPLTYREDIRQNVGLAYRGMSWEEYQQAMQRGWFASQGAFNLTGQGESVTFFSKDPATAVHYARSFQAWPFIATPGRPGVVIAAPRSLLVDYLGGIGLSEEQKDSVRRQIKRNPHVNEMVRWGKLDIANVRGAWMVYPTVMKSGYVEVVRRMVPRRSENRYDSVDWVPMWDSGSASGPDGSHFVIVPLPEFDAGLGGLR